MEIKLTEPETREYLRYLATKKVAWQENELLLALNKLNAELAGHTPYTKDSLAFRIASISDEVAKLQSKLQEFHYIQSAITPAYDIFASEPIKDALIRAVKTSLHSYAKFDTEEAAQERANLITAYEILIRHTSV